MGIKLLLVKLGLGGNHAKNDRIKRISPMTRDRMHFEEESAEQFRELKKKGLSIPVFTL